MRPLLSKTTYMYGMQCHKRFYLNRFHKELANPEEEQAQAIFQTGTNVGLLAQQLFPGGVNAQGEEEWHSEKTVKRTAELLHKHSIIYEAAFMFNDVLCAVDILVQKGNKFYAYEVKSTNNVKEQHIEDAALQYYILSNCGLNLQDFSIIHFDKEYIRIGEVEVAKLFTATSVLEAVEAKQSYISKNIADFKKLIYLKRIPEVEMGPHCNKPYACNFSNYCLSLVEQEAIEENDLDQTIVINQEAWADFTQDFQYPLFFFDFETVMYAVPEFDFSRPYQQIPFQYSLHILFEPNATPKHNSHLGDGIADPRPDLIEKMLRDLGSSGTILAWNMSFEKGVIAKLAIDFPEYHSELMAIHSRIVDLMTPFRPKKAVVYSEAFGGSYSIKKVLPVLVPELSYGNLNIQEGGTASFMYGQMAMLEPIDRNQLREDLLAYCHLDTLAMVRIWERVESGIHNER
jgi:hypothetical protein